MALHATMRYSAKCEDCSELACGGCYDENKERTLRCAIGCGWMQPQDDQKVIYCQGCKGDRKCRKCGAHFTYVDRNHPDPDVGVCNECREAS